MTIPLYGSCFKLGRFFYILAIILKYFSVLKSNAFLLLACLFCGVFVARAQVVSVDLFNADNGLPQTTVNAVIQDSTGFLWIGTPDGLCRYDGYQFVVYANNPLDSTSICNNYIYSIVDDCKGNLWVGTRLGLSRFQKSTGKFKNYFSDSHNPNSIASNRIYSVYRDKQGMIWVKTLETLHLYNPLKDHFIRYSHYNDLFTLPSDAESFPVLEDSQGRLWVGTKDGLMLFDKQLTIFRRFVNDPLNTFSLSSNRILSIFEDSYGNLWVGTDDGLNKFNPKANQFTRYYCKPGSSASLPGNAIEYIGEDSAGFLWIATDGGLCKLFSDGHFELVNNLVNNDKKINLVRVSAIFRDKSNVLWIGSQIGLVKWNPYGARFKGYSKDINGNALFSNNIIASIFEEKGVAWVGTRGGGLHLFNPKSGENIKFSKEVTGCGLTNNYIRAIFKTGKGEVLVGTRNGLFLYNSTSKRFVNYFDAKSIYVSDVFRNNTIYSMDEDKEGNLWIATQTGLHCVKKTGLVSLYSRRRDSLSLSGNEVYDVMVDSNGKIWAATSSGLDCITANVSKVTHFQRAKKYTGTELISDEILCLHEDSNGFIWIGTSSGLHRYNPGTNQFKLYTELQNLPSKVINAIEEDYNGRLWISTNKGLVMLNPVTNLVRSYTTSDGLLSNEFNVGVSYRSSSGAMYFGTSAGFNCFNPDSIPINSNVPKLSFTRIGIMGSQGIEIVNPDGHSKIKIPYDFKTLTIEFSALDFNHPEKNLYRYQMLGLDDKWMEIGNKHSATFTSLEEGTYNFKVIGANSDQIWSADPISLKIQITAPFWRSKVAYIVYTSLAVILLLVYLNHRNKNLKRINKLLREREMVMAELQDQKEELMLNNKSMTDSINYAKRIQDAILPSIDTFKTLLPDSFILFMPKDIVSGDFYWINETKNKTFVAVVDCTGHGVPGAFMSIIGMELLRNITNVEGIDDAAEILNRLSISIHETFTAGVKHTEDGIKVKDGMDVAFCVLDKEYNILQYSGAFSNLFLLHDGKIIEFKGDRYSVGMASETGHLLFSSYFIPIQPNDMIYIFTDGYVDQFGGTDGKKLKFRRFRHLLLNIYRMPLEAQRKYLYDSMLEWRGDNEQVDDILIIGIRPDLSCMF